MQLLIFFIQRQQGDKTTSYRIKNSLPPLISLLWSRDLVYITLFYYSFTESTFYDRISRSPPAVHHSPCVLNPTLADLGHAISLLKLPLYEENLLSKDNHFE